jgi:hypothetical protein
MEAKIIIPKGFRKLRSSEHYEKGDRFLKTHKGKNTWSFAPGFIGIRTSELMSYFLIRRVSMKRQKRLNKNNSITIQSKG